MEDKIDIHRRERHYEREIQRLETETTFCDEDREALLRFVWDCKLGKTSVGKCKKKIGKSRIMKYVQNLRLIARWLGKPLGQACQEDIERLVCGIDDNVYDNRGKNYAEESKRDFKKTLRKYYRWLGKQGMIDFISLASVPKDVPALTREQVEEMINSTHLRDLKAAIMVLFDGGLRIEELLNLRLKDVTRERYTEDTSCFWVDARYSKTFARKIPLPLSTKHLENWLAMHPESRNPDAQVFPIKYQAFLKRLRTLSRLVLNRKVNPHMLRHSSATYWAPKMNRYTLCAKYGWAFSSDMPDRYIKRKGIIFTEIAEKGDVEQTAKLEKENRAIKEKMEDMQRDYEKLKKALETIMPVVMERMDEPRFRKKLFEKKKEELLAHQDAQYQDNRERIQAVT